jgi:hypothetical protein
MDSPQRTRLQILADLDNVYTRFSNTDVFDGASPRAVRAKHDALEKIGSIQALFGGEGGGCSDKENEGIVKVASLFYF